MKEYKVIVRDEAGFEFAGIIELVEHPHLMDWVEIKTDKGNFVEGAIVEIF